MGRTSSLKIMCYVLEVITKKEVSKDDLDSYQKDYGITFYNKTRKMNNPQKGAYYYAVFSGGCSCNLYGLKGDYSSWQIMEFFKKYVEEGNITLFFIWEDDHYSSKICYDLHSYIDSPKNKKVTLPISEFLDVFMTKDFDGENIIYTIFNDQRDLLTLDKS